MFPVQVSYLRGDAEGLPPHAHASKATGGEGLRRDQHRRHRRHGDIPRTGRRAAGDIIPGTEFNITSAIFYFALLLTARALEYNVL